jgi:hypothetical protein
MALNQKISSKPLSSIDFILRFVFFICSKFFSHLFTNFDAKSMNERSFELIFEFKTILTYPFPLNEDYKSSTWREKNISDEPRPQKKKQVQIALRTLWEQ